MTAQRHSVYGDIAAQHEPSFLHARNDVSISENGGSVAVMFVIRPGRDRRR